jgi:hypothetical protein
MDQPTEPVSSYGPSSRHGDRWLARPQRRGLPQGTVRTVAVVVVGVLGQDRPKLSVSENEHPVQDFTPDGADPPLRMGIRPRRPHRREKHLDRFVGEDRVERGGELGVPIADQEPAPADAVLQAQEQGTGLLATTLRLGGCEGHAEQVDPAAGHLQHHQHLPPLQDHGVDGAAVHRQHPVGLGAEDLLAGDRRPLGRRPGGG